MRYFYLAEITKTINRGALSQKTKKQVSGVFISEAVPELVFEAIEESLKISENTKVVFLRFEVIK